MTTYIFKHYDHYSFSGMFLNINRMLIDGEYYTLEFSDPESDHAGTSITGSFHNLNVIENRLDTWLANEYYTKMILSETKQYGFIQIK